MSAESSERGSNGAVVLVVVLAVLLIPCLGGLFLAGFGLFAFRATHVPAPPLPAAPMAVPVGPLTVPLEGAEITINNMRSTKNLFEAGDQILTREKFDRIKPGMTYEEAIVILEIPQTKLPDDMNLVEPESNVELNWHGGANDDKSITLRLKGKKIVEKSQTGL
jgi:hypothetical protein